MKLSRKTKRDYGLEEVQRGLAYYAYSLGNRRRAARELEAATGLKVPPDTLHTWATRTHREEYERVRAEILPRVGAEVADELIASARENTAVESEAREHLKGKLAELPPKELSTTVRNLATSAGIQISRARELQGDYATPAAHEVNIGELLRRLESRGAVDAEVVDESDVSELEQRNGT